MMIKGGHKISLSQYARAFAAACVVLFSLNFSSQSLAEEIPRELQDVGIDEHLGSNIDLGMTFQDETGNTVPLKTYFNGTKPVLFFLVYYECPNLCTFVLNAATDSIKKMDWTAGDKFEMVAVSVDPRETPELAQRKKLAYLKAYGRPAGDKGWHFLVGKQPEITKLASQLGFKYKWDKESQQFAHTSAMFVVGPEGKISRYFYGIDYPTHDVRVALLEASKGRIGNVIDKILLFCYHYDASTKKYVLLASRMMTAGGAITLFFLCLFLLRAWSHDRSTHMNA